MLERKTGRLNSKSYPVAQFHILAIHSLYRSCSHCLPHRKNEGLADLEALKIVNPGPQPKMNPNFMLVSKVHLQRLRSQLYPCTQILPRKINLIMNFSGGC